MGTTARREPAFALLGPLEARGPRGPLALGPPRRRAVLALLLVHANELVPAERLVEGIWGFEAPRTVRQALYGHVSELRKLLAPAGARLERIGPGYVLRLDERRIDAHRFERLAQEGRRALHADPARAAATLRAALALWRGPALADVADGPFAAAEAARLEELRLAALEDRIEAELALGHARALVGEIEALCGEHPLRERLCAQLMLALYRSGRQAEALATYRSLRQRLAAELGLEPGPGLRRLERSILRHEAALDAPGLGSSRADPVRDDLRRLVAALIRMIDADDGGRRAAPHPCGWMRRAEADRQARLAGGRRPSRRTVAASGR